MISFETKVKNELNRTEHSIYYFNNVLRQFENVKIDIKHEGRTGACPGWGCPKCFTLFPMKRNSRGKDVGRFCPCYKEYAKTTLQIKVRTIIRVLKEKVADLT